MLKLDKCIQISERISELLNQECDCECQIHAMMCTRIKLYYRETEEIVNQCLKNNSDDSTLETLLKENYNRNLKMFENVLTRFREINTYAAANFSWDREQIK